MAEEINLLHGRNKSRLKIGKQAAKVKLVSFIVLALYLLSGTGLFIYLVWAKNEKIRLDRSIQAKKQRIVDLKKNELLHVNLKQRLFFLTKEVDLNPNLATGSINLLNELNDSKILISNFSLAKDGQVAVSGQVIDVLALADFLTKLNKEKSKTKVAVLNSLSRSETSAYDFNLSLILD